MGDGECHRGRDRTTDMSDSNETKHRSCCLAIEWMRPSHYREQIYVLLSAHFRKDSCVDNPSLIRCSPDGFSVNSDLECYPCIVSFCGKETVVAKTWVIFPRPSSQCKLNILYPKCLEPGMSRIEFFKFCSICRYLMRYLGDGTIAHM